MPDTGPPGCTAAGFLKEGVLTGAAVGSGSKVTAAGGLQEGQGLLQYGPGSVLARCALARRIVDTGMLWKEEI